MSSNFDPTDVYLTRSSVINEERNSLGVYLTPVSAVTDLREKNQRSHPKNLRNERSNTISIASSSLDENDDEFGVYLTNVNTKKNYSPVNITDRSKKRAIVQDVYDEDHYCLARNSGGFSDELKISNKQENINNVSSSKSKKCTCTVTFTRNRILIAILIIIIFLLGGCVTYLILKGTLLYPSLVIVCLFNIECT